ncbi:MAG: chemotaxis protein CheX [Ruminococcus sp.]|nr:chemotaxis protein CheX [Ruminococcus sp.]MBQ7070699.1 chemotaxis protein CheX [Ruminococcus sp.]
MFAQFFGGYLFNHKLCSAEDLTQAFEAKKYTRLRLGVLAINAGLMTAEQVEHVNITQQSVDKRFGDLAVELGYVTEEDVERLLSQQPTDYLLLGQTLVNNGALTNAEFEKAINDYKAENQLSDDDISDNQNETLGKLIREFYHFDSAVDAKINTEYVTLLFKNIIRFIGDDFTPLEASVVKDYRAENLIIQHINGTYSATACIGAYKDAYIGFAERFAKESFSEVDDFVHATVGEFLNVNDGLFVVNESNERGVELTLTPQELSDSSEIFFDDTAFCIPVVFPFGQVDFIISNH